MDRLTKQQIDTVFMVIYPNLENCTSAYLYKHNKFHIDKETVINEAYLHLIKHSDDIKVSGDVLAYCYTFIHNSIRWANSKINKEERINSIVNSFNNIDVIDDEEDEVNDKLLIEEWYNDRLDTLIEYRRHLKDPVLEIVFDLYFYEGYTSSRKMAAKLNINKDYAGKYIKQIKQGLINYDKDNQNRSTGTTAY